MRLLNLEESTRPEETKTRMSEASPDSQATSPVKEPASDDDLSGGSLWGMLSIDKIREKAAAAAVAGTPLEQARRRLEALHEGRKTALDTKIEQSRLRMRVVQEGLERRLSEAEKVDPATVERLGDFERQVTDLQEQKRGLEAELIGIVYEARAAIRSEREVRAAKDRKAREADAEARYDAVLKDWKEREPNRREVIARLGSARAAAIERHDRVQSGLGLFESIGFTPKVQRLLLWVGSLTWPASGLVFAALLFRQRANANLDILGDGDVLDAIGRVFDGVASDPSAWFWSRFFPFLTIVLGGSALLCVIVWIADLLMARFDPRWRTTSSESPPDPTGNLLANIESAIQPGTGRKSALSERQTRGSFAAILSRLPLLIFGSIVLFFLVEVNRAVNARASNVIPAMYFYVGLMFGPLAASVGALLTMAMVGSRRLRLPVLSAIAVGLLSLLAAVIVNGGLSVWQCAAGVLAMGMFGTGVALVHRGIAGLEAQVRDQIASFDRRIEVYGHPPAPPLPTASGARHHDGRDEGTNTTDSARTLLVAMIEGIPGRYWYVRRALRAALRSNLSASSPIPPPSGEPPAAPGADKSVTLVQMGPVLSDVCLPDLVRTKWNTKNVELERLSGKLEELIEQRKSLRGGLADPEAIREEIRKHRLELADKEVQWAKAVRSLHLLTQRQFWEFEHAYEVCVAAMVPARRSLKEKEVSK